jgi:hypothetical protein
MSEKTAPALQKLDGFIPLLKQLPDGPNKRQLLEESEMLRRAVAAFHMEAIRFRMFSVDRLLKTDGNDTTRAMFDELRHLLEAAGFHTRSHAAPGT